jgi:acetyltransferase-like isoleucine patch superfamily enzyme
VKSIPYYEPKAKLSDQIKQSSERRKLSKVTFIARKLLNWTYSSLAWNCPLNGLRVKFQRRRGVKIGSGVMLGFRCTLDHAYPEYLTLEDNCALAGNVYLIAHSNPYKHFKGKLLSYVAPIVIKEGAWVGINSTILPGVTVGKNSVVSAGAVVSESVPDNCIVAGNPAKVIRRFAEL